MKHEYPKIYSSLYDILPDHIKATAIQWGMGDTVFRDNTYEFLEELKNS